MDIATFSGDVSFTEFPEEVLITEGTGVIQCLQVNDHVIVKLELKSVLTNDGSAITSSIALDQQQLEKLISALEQCRFICERRV